jgi:hypothetical protein
VHTKILVAKIEMKRTLGRPVRRWEDNIEIYLELITYEVWTEFIWLRIESSGGLL